MGSITLTPPPHIDETPDALPPLDKEAFAVQLWNPPPEQRVAAAETRSRPPRDVKPFRLQLIGIIHEDGTRRAAVYDPDDDRLGIVGEGDEFASRLVTTVTLQSVTFTDGERTHTLELIQPPRGTEPAGTAASDPDDTATQTQTILPGAATGVSS